MSIINGHKIHPAADLFPMIPQKELEELAEDIKTNGLIEKIARLPDGRILDGRNRLRACHMAGVKPKFIEKNPQFPAKWVLSKNIHRRHLTTSEKAAICIKLEPMYASAAAARKKEGNRRGGSRSPVKKDKSGAILHSTSEEDKSAAAEVATSVGISPRTSKAAIRNAKIEPKVEDYLANNTMNVHETTRYVNLDEGSRRNVDKYIGDGVTAGEAIKMEVKKGQSPESQLKFQIATLRAKLQASMSLMENISEETSNPRSREPTMLSDYIAKSITACEEWEKNARPKQCQPPANKDRCHLGSSV